MASQEAPPSRPPSSSELPACVNLVSHVPTLANLASARLTARSAAVLTQAPRPACPCAERITAPPVGCDPDRSPGQAPELDPELCGDGCAGCCGGGGDIGSGWLWDWTAGWPRGAFSATRGAFSVAPPRVSIGGCGVGIGGCGICGDRRAPWSSDSDSACVGTPMHSRPTPRS